MQNVKIIILALLIAGSCKVFGQSTNIPLNRDYYHLIERYEIKRGTFSPYFHATMRPYTREGVAKMTDELLDDSTAWYSAADKFNLQYLSNDNWEWSKYNFNDSKKPIWRHFYKKKSDLLHVDEDGLDLHLSPVIHFSGGRERGAGIINYVNTRGAELRGMINRRVGFYSFIGTTQATFPAYVRDYINERQVVPNEGFWKRFGEQGVDYFTPRGYISFDLIDEYVNFQFGFDKLFIGNGHRSVMLSDFANNYTFAKINTKIWKLNYTNIFAQTYADVRGVASGLRFDRYPRKYFVAHHLSTNITKNFNIGLFEAVSIGDSINQSLDFEYLNPIIFYRALEHQGGSPYSMKVGMDARWNIFNSISLYGQFLLDEFYLKEIRARNGWWANKFAAQAGLKYIDALGVDNLDVQLEFNTARPYMYTHVGIFTNYTHYRMPLAHPMGANFREYLSIIRYQPLPRLSFTGLFVWLNYGSDEANTNWGTDIMKPYTTREQDYGNRIGQGIATRQSYMDLTFSYHLKHNMFADLRLIMRNKEKENQSPAQETTFISTSLRWNIARIIHDF